MLRLLSSEQIRTSLENLPEVRRAVVDGPPYRIFLICDSTPDTPSPEPMARAVLAGLGVAPEEVELTLSYVGAPPTRRRVRFVDVMLDRPRVGIVRARVQVEWGGRLYEGWAEGEGGSAGELRVCAHATTQALEVLLNGAVTFSLVGVKAIRIFDQDLVAALLHSPQAADRQLVGVSLVASDTCRSAAVAVLSATNRLLGNYLVTAD